MNDEGWLTVEGVESWLREDLGGGVTGSLEECLPAAPITIGGVYDRVSPPRLVSGYEAIPALCRWFTSPDRLLAAFEGTVGGPAQDDLEAFDFLPAPPTPPTRWFILADGIARCTTAEQGRSSYNTSARSSTDESSAAGAPRCADPDISWGWDFNHADTMVSSGGVVLWYPGLKFEYLSSSAGGQRWIRSAEELETICILDCCGSSDDATELLQIFLAIRSLQFTYGLASQDPAKGRVGDAPFDLQRKHVDAKLLLRSLPPPHLFREDATFPETAGTTSQCAHKLSAVSDWWTTATWRMTWLRGTGSVLVLADRKVFSAALNGRTGSHGHRSVWVACNARHGFDSARLDGGVSEGAESRAALASHGTSSQLLSMCTTHAPARPMHNGAT